MATSYICIGKNIRRARKKAGLTQNEMAQKLGISVTHYSNQERAQRGISIENLVHICRILDIPLEELLKGAVGGIRIYDDGKEYVPNSEAELVRQFSEIISTCRPTAKRCMIEMCLRLPRWIMHGNDASMRGSNSGQIRQPWLV